MVPKYLNTYKANIVVKNIKKRKKKLFRTLKYLPRTIKSENILFCFTAIARIFGVLNRTVTTKPNYWCRFRISYH